MRLVFAGTPDFAARALEALFAAGHEVALVLSQPDRPAGRGLRASAGAVARLARERGLALSQPESLQPAASLAPIVAARPEALVVAAYGLLLPPDVLGAAPLGALNIHASLLPRWRGAAPIQRALLAGDRTTGVTIMQMDAGLDTGPILAQQSIPIEPGDDAGALERRLAELGAGMIVEALAALKAGRLQPRAQPAEGASYARKIGRDEARLDWSRPAAELERAVRAFRPTPGAQARLGAEALKIWQARLAAGRGAPGQVLGADEAGIVVACGEGALAIEALQRAGGKRLDAAAFLRGRPVRAGERFETGGG